MQKSQLEDLEVYVYGDIHIYICFMYIYILIYYNIVILLYYTRLDYKLHDFSSYLLFFLRGF